eukprot:TRINITY_DN11773_c0_g1_i1.p1 TRINITY_DN11773_c0_g1~~TRINITY_DN11773_c0_g1_i1.p1  ORF type:complete len:262 (+),score=71.43 TRINITY_DN11773_c0_g1_i1:354-1139(+)
MKLEARAQKKETSKILDIIANQRGKVKKSKEKYFRDSKSLSESTTEEIMKNRKKAMNSSLEEYKQHVALMNSYIDENYEKYKQRLETFNMGEETRIGFLKSIFAHLFSISEEIIKTQYASIEESKSVVGKVIPKLNIKALASLEPPSKENVFEKAVFEEGEYINKVIATKASDSPHSVAITGASLIERITEGEEVFIKESLEKRLDDIPLEEERKKNLFEVLKKTEARKCLAMYMSLQGRKIEVTKDTVFETALNLSLIHI